MRIWCDPRNPAWNATRRLVRMPLLQDQVYCSTTGSRQEVRCLVGGRMNSSEQEGYTTFQSCSEASSTFGGVVKFEVTCAHLAQTAFSAQFACSCLLRELLRRRRAPRSQLLMILLFVVSYSFASKRKKKLLAIQHHRIASYLSH